MKNLNHIKLDFFLIDCLYLMGIIKQFNYTINLCQQDSIYPQANPFPSVRFGT